MLDDYRQRYEEYQTSLKRDEYRYAVGEQSRREKDAIKREYSDLFSLTAISELRKELEAVPDYRETLVTGIRRLLAFASEEHLMYLSRELNVEIDDYEISSSSDYEQALITYRELAGTIAAEKDNRRRRELDARRSDLVSAIEDLHTERLRIWINGIKGLGYDSFPAMRLELRGVDEGRTAADAKRFLSKTETTYAVSIDHLLSAELGIDIDEAIAADLNHLQLNRAFDEYFPEGRIGTIYREFFSGFGFQPERQRNLRIVEISGDDVRRQNEVIPVLVPDDVRLFLFDSGGQYDYRRFLKSAGQAQNFAWTSRAIAPEFRIISAWADIAVSEAWGMLFENLMLDEYWLSDALGISESGAIRDAQRRLRLSRIRMIATKCIYAYEVLSSGSIDDADVKYGDILGDGLRVRIVGADYLPDLNPGRNFGSRVRAAILESQLRDYLKTSFGNRWWASLKAGEMVIDLWNLGQRHTADEMASLIGLGEPDIDWLIAELNER